MPSAGGGPITVQTVTSQEFKRRVGYYSTLVSATDRAVGLDRVGHGETVFVVSKRAFDRLQQLVERHGWEDAPELGAET